MIGNYRSDIMKNVITSVMPDSIAEEVGIEENDILLSVNGEKIVDIIDYRFLTNDEEIVLEIQKPNGEVWDYEIEKEYFDGKLTVDTIEEAWNRKYQEYLGFTPKNHQEGILQDVHWASGCVGYFQGYALGDAYAAQFAHKLLTDCPDAFEKLEKGDSSAIGNWLKEHIHQYGQTYSAREMLKKATGEELNTDYYIEYLKEKYLH